VKILVCEESRLLNALVLFVYVVVEVRSCEVGFVSGWDQRFVLFRGRDTVREESYPMFIIVLIPAPLAPRSC